MKTVIIEVQVKDADEAGFLQSVVWELIAGRMSPEAKMIRCRYAISMDEGKKLDED